MRTVELKEFEKHFDEYFLYASIDGLIIEVNGQFKAKCTPIHNEPWISVFEESMREEKLDYNLPIMKELMNRYMKEKVCD